MENELKLVSGAMVTLSLATAAMIVVPFLQLKDEPAPEALKPYSSQELRGRSVYMANGCIACHTQQPSTTGAGIADARRGWGRASETDYAPADSSTAAAAQCVRGRRDDNGPRS